MVKLSIIILNFNDQHFLPECLDSLEKQTLKDFEIILVDNGSDYHSHLELIKILNQYKNNLAIKLVQSKYNLFFAGGNNKGLKYTGGKYICLLNNDTVVNSDFVKKSIKCMESLTSFGFMSPRINFYDDKRKPRFWGSRITPFSLDFITPLKKVYLNEIKESGHAAGAALFTSKETINKLGQLDEIFFIYYEEVDWCTRAKKRYGLNNYYYPGTVVFHKEVLSKTEKYYNYYLHLRNYQIFVWKNYSLIIILTFYLFHYPYYLIKSYIAAIYRFKFKRFLIIPRAAIMGLIIGVRRRSNRGCKKYMGKDYRYLKNLVKNNIRFLGFYFKG